MKIGDFSKGVLLAAIMVAVPFSSAWATHRTVAEQAIAAAKAAQEKATSAGAASNESAQMIKEAEGLLASRQYTKALHLADEAKKLSESALTEAKAKPAASAAAAGTPAPASSSSPGAGAATGSSADAEKAIAAAELARKRAASVGGEWRDTGKMIKQAKQAASSGDYAEAVRLADKARRQGDLGYEQALHEKNAGFPPYMK
jgi:hypothetical protein